jgi:hypothetical protein
LRLEKTDSLRANGSLSAIRAEKSNRPDGHLMLAHGDAIAIER